MNGAAAIHQPDIHLTTFIWDLEPCIFFTCLKRCAPIIVVEWLKLLLHIQKVPGSNLGPETN
jgi:hypothetical protein